VRRGWVAVGAACAFGGCAVSLRGAVYPGPTGEPILHLAEGGTRRLVLPPNATPLAGLDGEGVRLEGHRTLRGVRVVDWTVPEGTRGLQTWVGVVERRSGNLVIHDRNSKALYFLNEVSYPSLGNAVGRTVLVEGWVEGAHAVRPAYVRVLDAP
jgi:hypothetical protein